MNLLHYIKEPPPVLDVGQVVVHNYARELLAKLDTNLLAVSVRRTSIGFKSDYQEDR